MKSILRSARIGALSRRVASPLSRLASTASSASPPRPSDTFVSSSGSYLDQMYESWQHDPSSVHLSWQLYFDSLSSNAGATRSGYLTSPPTLVPNDQVDVAKQSGVPSEQVLDHMKVQLMVRAYQVRGHQLAATDPLEITKRTFADAPELSYEYYGYTEKDLDRKFFLGVGILPLFQKEKGTEMTLRDIVSNLKSIYCSSIGIELGHISDRASCDWLRTKFETPNRFSYSKQQKLTILDRLVWSDSFEKFVAGKYPSEKRFGLEGCESLIPGMKGMIDTLVESGVNQVVIGMPHRGRLNVLSNVVRKPNDSILSEFSGSLNNTVEGSGDVKYHLGMNYERPTPSGKMVSLTLVANPSHLEAVNPVVQGKVRALQFAQGLKRAASLATPPQQSVDDRSTAIGILLHGDAAFAGQGVVYESLGFSELPAYTTGGTIHIIVNNQIGFTTDPRFSRSTPYCTDVAKTIDAPIFHVNGDDPEAVVFACELAGEWRSKWRKDVVVDVVCYRKHGHNEIDQPGFTQPLMYQRVSKMVPVVEKYTKQLLAEEITQQEIDALKQRVWTKLEQAYEDSKSYKANNREWQSSAWPDFKSPAELAERAFAARATGLPLDLLTQLGLASSAIPSSSPTAAAPFTLHPNLAKILKTREKSITTGEQIDWSTAEALSFASLLSQDIHVRLSGQDVERGTFSQRHAVLHDQATEQEYTPLKHLVENAQGGVIKQAPFTVCNSSLSEYAVLGFELGYAMTSPHQLVLWEAQFGDFANNAQCIIDQFISSGEQKWLQRSALTMLLPHGYDGQGPEHSSARIERFLQLSDENPYLMPSLSPDAKHSYARQHQDCNMQICYPTVPSNYFHLLRRQVEREFRKPLVVFVSKGLLRHPLAKSSLAEMGPGTRFQRLIPEVLHPVHASPVASPPASKLVDSRIPHALTSSLFTLLPPSKTTTIIFCSGQIYYPLYKTRELNGLNHVAIIRLEQIAPFPFWEIKEQIDRYPNVTEIVWAQEESMNSGSWSFVGERLHTAIRETDWFKSGKGKQWQATLDTTRVPGGLENGKLTAALEKKSIRGLQTVRYAGRDSSAAPATGFKKQHKYEEEMVLSEALMGGELRRVKESVNGSPRFE